MKRAQISDKSSKTVWSFLNGGRDYIQHLSKDGGLRDILPSISLVLDNRKSNIGIANYHILLQNETDIITKYDSC